MITQIFNFILAFTFFSMNNQVNKDATLVYENFNKKKIFYPIDINKISTLYSNSGSILLSINDMLNLSGRQKISNELFDFLCDQNVINQWNIFGRSGINPYSNNQKKFIEDRKKDLTLYYLGAFAIAKEFNCHLFLIVDDENVYTINRRLVLMNTHNSRLMSLTQIAVYTCFEGVCKHAYSEILSDCGVFLLKEMVISSDVEFLDESAKDLVPQCNDILSKRFYFDKRGYLKEIE